MTMDRTWAGVEPYTGPIRACTKCRRDYRIVVITFHDAPLGAFCVAACAPCLLALTELPNVRVARSHGVS